MNALEVQDLKKSFRQGFFLTKKEILHGISFEVEPGVATGFLGKNGSGKTTTIKCVLELVFKDSGTVKYFGKPEFTKDIRRNIGFLPEHPYFYDYLTAQEVLEFYGELSDCFSSKKDLRIKIEELLELVHLKHVKNSRLRTFSKGMLQRIGIAQTLIHDPAFIILDEPMSGLDPDGRHLVAKIINNMVAQKKTVFFSSHLLHDTEMLCQNLVVLRQGNLVYSGRQEDLLRTLEAGIKLKYRQGNEIKEIVAADEGDLQIKVDQLRQGRLEVLEIIPNRPSLEEAFIKIAEGGSDV